MKKTLLKRLKSFTYAFHGLKILIREEPNARIHLFAAFSVLIVGVYYRISSLEWIALVFAIGLVIAFEIVNSSIEGIADFISPDKHHAIKKIKDLAAAGVLIAAFTALTVAFIVFLPKIFDL